MSSPAPWPALRATYHVTAPDADELAVRIDSLLLEQTVELPRVALRDSFVLENIVGRLVSNDAIETGIYSVVIDFPIIATADDPAQFLNVLFGNSSLQQHVMLADFELPTNWPGRENALPGPRFGGPGLRTLLDIHDRAITSTALKPIGLSNTRIAELCGLFAQAGVDVIKDDHGLANHSFHPFVERVRMCQKAVVESNRASGRRSMYAPNLTGTPSAVLEQLRVAQEEGVGAVMIAPMLLGLPLLAEITQRFAKVPILGHPSFGGATRIAPEVLYGKIFPLYGSDATIFANFGGRFAYSKDTCGRIAGELTGPSIPGLTPTLPMPAGGIQYKQVTDVLNFYGKDVVLLIGGGLYEAGNDVALRARAEEFVRQVAEFKS